MKDIVIPKSKIKRELYVWLCLFLLSFAANIYAIIDYGAKWNELITQIHWVIIISVGLYILSWFIRWLIYLVIRLIKKIT